MGYRNQPVIQDLYGVEAGAKAFGQVTQALVQGAQQFAKVAEDRRLKKIKEDEAQTNLSNTVLLKGEEMLRKEKRSWQDQGFSPSQIAKWQKQGNIIFKGDNSYTGGVIDEDNIGSIGVLQAQTLILGKRFNSARERELLEEKKQEGEDFLTLAYQQAGGWGSEAQQGKPYVEGGFSDVNFGLRGFNFIDQLGSKFTLLDITGKTNEVPGLTSVFDRNKKTGIQTWTHHINKDSNVLPRGETLSASGIGDTTIVEEEDRYKIVQTFPANFDGNILRSVREKRDWKEAGKDKVTDTSGNLLQKYIFQLPTAITKVKTDKGKATNKEQAIKRNYMSGQALSDAMYVVLDDEAGTVVNGMDLQDQVLYMASRYKIDLNDVEGYLDKFNPEQRFDYIKKQAKNQMLLNYGAGIGGQGGFKKEKMTDKLAIELLRGKTNGDEALQSIPDQYIVDPEDASKTIKNPAYKEWYDGDHYVKTVVGNPVSDGSQKLVDPRLITEWKNFDFKNFLNNDYGLDATEATWFIPATAVAAAQNETTANRIAGHPDNKGAPVEIIQIGANLWQPRQLLQAGGGSSWRAVGKARTKDFFDSWLGIKLKK